MLEILNKRSRDVFEIVVENYLRHGEAISSKFAAKKMQHHVSSATIRNIFQDLERNGLLISPHTSAGRIPTDIGLKLYVNAYIESNNAKKIHDEDYDRLSRDIEKKATLEEIMQNTSKMLSSLSREASFIVVPKNVTTLKQIEFLPVAENKVLAVLVGENGMIENMIFQYDTKISASELIEISNYLTYRLCGRTMEQVQYLIRKELEAEKNEFEQLKEKLSEEEAIHDIASRQESKHHFVITGKSNLFNDVQSIQELEYLRTLLDRIEKQQTILDILSLTEKAESVQVFIGAKDTLFYQAGCSVILNTQRDQDNNIVGAVGVIGPKRMNYAKIIPIVDYTGDLIRRLLHV